MTGPVREAQTLPPADVLPQSDFQGDLLRRFRAWVWKCKTGWGRFKIPRSQRNQGDFEASALLSLHLKLCLGKWPMQLVPMCPVGWHPGLEFHHWPLLP